MPHIAYKTIAGCLSAMTRCNAEWQGRHADTIETICKDYLPGGSGFDAGTKLDMDASKPDKLVFLTSFHHMDEAGGYDGWTEHRVTVRPSLIHDFVLTISGRDRNDIKDYIAECFSVALRVDVPPEAFK